MFKSHFQANVAFLDKNIPGLRGRADLTFQRVGFTKLISQAQRNRKKQCLRIANSETLTNTVTQIQNNKQKRVPWLFTRPLRLPPQDCCHI